MKFSKKILSILLAVMLAFSVFGICASAAGTASGNEAITVTLSTDAENYDGGATVTVRVNVQTNYNCTALRLPIMFDSSVFEVPTLINLQAAGTAATAGALSSNANASAYIPENYDASSFGCVLVQWTAGVASGAVNCLNIPDGELAFTFRLKAKSSAAGLTGDIFIPAESETNLLYYQAIQDPTDASSFYYLNPGVYTFNNCQASVNGADVSLIPNADYGSTAVIDERNLLVYGLETGLDSAAAVKTQVKATGGAIISVVSGEMGYGTGTEIQLKVGGTTVKSYTIVIFGDLNGDCMIDAADLSMLTSAVGQSLTIETNAVAMAADVNGDTVVDAGDLSKLISVVGQTVTISQTNPYD